MIFKIPYNLCDYEMSGTPNTLTAGVYDVAMYRLQQGPLYTHKPADFTIF